MKFTPYSFSKQDTFYSCQNKFHLKYIQKIRGKSVNPALEKGSFIHLAIEEDIKKPEPWLPEFTFELMDEKAQDEVMVLAKKILSSDYQNNLRNISSKADYVGIEEGFGFDFNWDANGYDKTYKLNIIQGFIDLCMVKGKTGVVIDHKTGKYKDPKWQSYEQVMLYALWMFKKFPELENVKCVYNYVESDQRNTKTYTRTEMGFLEKKFKDKLQKIESTKKFEKNITKLCNWCDFLKSGHCQLTDKELLKVI